MVSYKRYWPLYALQLFVEELELRLPREADIYALAAVAEEGVSSSELTPFARPWTSLPPLERGRRTLQHIWSRLGKISADKWDIPLIVLRNNEVVGCQNLRAENFPILRDVETGSWLGEKHQGQGIGTKMRTAALEFAFTTLGAATAHSGAYLENHASQRVSQKLGYRKNGNTFFAAEGKRRVTQEFLLAREEWNPPFSVEIRGADHCRDILDSA